MIPGEAGALTAHEMVPDIPSVTRAALAGAVARAEAAERERDELRARLAAAEAHAARLREALEGMAPDTLAARGRSNGGLVYCGGCARGLCTCGREADCIEAHSALAATPAASAARWRAMEGCAEALRSARNTIATSRRGSIGSIDNVYMATVNVESVEAWSDALAVLDNVGAK